MMRCITAICPAGPPKESAATRSHTRHASPNETPCAGRGRVPAATEISVMPLAPSGPQLRVPVVGLILAAAAPRVERVVHRHAVLEHFMVVGKIGRQPERQGKQPRGLRRKVEASRVGAT